ncbi:MAG: hypothetical protein AB1758_30950 [Candidatus Eremiobacterota bacterium]
MKQTLSGFTTILVPSRHSRTALLRRLERLVELLRQVQHLHDALMQDVQALAQSEPRPVLAPPAAAELARAGADEVRCVVEWFQEPVSRELEEFLGCLACLREADSKLCRAERMAAAWGGLVA